LFPTGGRGGAQKDNPFGPLASQESLVFDRAHRMMIAVNAGSNTVTTFRVRGDRLTGRHPVGSGEDFPTRGRRDIASRRPVAPSARGSVRPPVNERSGRFPQ
jgi:hypothetical protein